MKYAFVYNVLLALFLLHLQSALCQNIKPVPFKKDNKFGYLRGKDTLVQAGYDDADSFYEGKAVVSLDGKYGYINTSGKTVIPFQYRYAERFINGIAIIAEGETGASYSSNLYDCGIIDTNGKFILQPNCISIGDAYEGHYYFSVNGRTGYLDKNGKIIIPAIYDGYEGTCTDFIPRFSEGMIWVYKKGLFSLYDSTGRQILPLDSIGAMPFYGGTSVVCRDHKCGLMNKRGQLVIPYMYDLIDEFDEKDLIRAKKDTLYGYINRKNEILIPFKFKDAHAFGEERTAVSHGNKWSFIDRKGKLIAPYQFDDVKDFFHGEADVYIRPKVGMMNRNGKIIAPVKYDAFGGLRKDTFSYRVGDKWGFISRKGHEVTPALYAEVSLFNFEDGMAMVKQNGKWGFLDSTGKLAIPAIYDNASDFKNGKAEVNIKGKAVMIDKSGKEYNIEPEK